MKLLVRKEQGTTLPRWGTFQGDRTSTQKIICLAAKLSIERVLSVLLHTVVAIGGGARGLANE